MSHADEPSTRLKILRLLLEKGECSAPDLANELGITAAGIRRHLDGLTEDGFAERVRTRKAGRGRPATSYALTEKGRAQFGHSYDRLARQALETLRDAAGDEAIEAFARRRAMKIMAPVKPAGKSKASVLKTVDDLARVFRENGYAVTVQSAGDGVQICQHHCPIAHVAHDFPELCEAEHFAMAERLGIHVQRLATITNGNGVCTTNIPLITPHNPHKRSGS